MLRHNCYYAEDTAQTTKYDTANRNATQATVNFEFEHSDFDEPTLKEDEPFDTDVEDIPTGNVFYEDDAMSVDSFIHKPEHKTAFVEHAQTGYSFDLINRKRSDMHTICACEDGDKLCAGFNCISSEIRGRTFDENSNFQGHVFESFKKAGDGRSFWLARDRSFF